jgi:hypothetical protein
VDNLTSLEKLRLKNLRSLHGRPDGFGGPTSDFLVHFLNQKGMSLSNNELTHIYQGKKGISDYRAKAIEKAFDLSSGWMSQDHEFLYRLSPGEISTHSRLAALAPEIKQSIYALIDAIAPSKE